VNWTLARALTPICTQIHAKQSQTVARAPGRSDWRIELHTPYQSEPLYCRFNSECPPNAQTFVTRMEGFHQLEVDLVFHSQYTFETTKSWTSNVYLVLAVAQWHSGARSERDWPLYLCGGASTSSPSSPPAFQQALLFSKEFYGTANYFSIKC
jgi:hypothetical protein